jgi:phage tail-like protein
MASRTDPIEAHGDDPRGTFNFLVEIDDGDGVKARFTEVAGLKGDVEEFEIKEGGLNDRTHKLRGRIIWGPVTLKKGMGDEQFFWDWWQQVVDGGSMQDIQRNVSIILQDRDGSTTVRKWDLEKAWPKSWESTALNAGASEIAIETLVLNHAGITESTS